MENYETLIEAISALRKQGYTKDFNLSEDCIRCHEENIVLSPDEFQVDKFFRFEDNTSPSDQSIIYAISSLDQKIKGILVNAYGVYADSMTDDIVEKLRVR
jgi:hypothetical protein